MPAGFFAGNILFRNAAVVMGLSDSSLNISQKR